MTWRGVQRGEFFLEFQSEGVGYGVALYLGEDRLPCFSFFIQFSYNGGNHLLQPIFRNSVSDYSNNPKLINPPIIPAGPMAAKAVVVAAAPVEPVAPDATTKIRPGTPRAAIFEATQSSGMSFWNFGEPDRVIEYLTF